MTLDSSLLESATKQLQRVINPKNPLPILSCFLCTVKDKTLEISAYDGEVHLSRLITLDEADGEQIFAVESKYLTQALGALILQPITIETADDKLTIKHATGETFFPLSDAAEYPVLPNEERQELLTLDSDMTQRALKRCIWTTANDDLRPQMSGVYIGLEDGGVDIVASDGHSMVLTSQLLPDIDANRMGSFIMPRKAATLLLSLLPIDEDIIQMEWNSQWVQIHVGDYTLTFRQIEGKFPNYRSVIRASSPITVEIPVGLMAGSVKKVLPFSNSSSQLIKLSLTKNNMTVKADDYDFSRGAADNFNCEYDSKELLIGCDGKRMLNLLSHISSPWITLGLNTPSDSLIFQETDGDVEVTLLCMPMMIND